MNARFARRTAAAIVAIAAALTFFAPVSDAATPHSTYWMRNDAFYRDYPEVGSTVAGLSQGTTRATLDDETYFFQDGVWYQESNPGYVVVDPPTGISVPSLPAGYATIQVGDTVYFYSTGIYYVATLTGYEVTLAPIDTPFSEPNPDDTSPDTN